MDAVLEAAFLFSEIRNRNLVKKIDKNALSQLFQQFMVHPSVQIMLVGTKRWV